MRVAYVTHPDDGLLPPGQNSIGLIVFNTARVLNSGADVSLYARAGAPGDVTAYPGALVEVQTPIENALAAFSARYPRWAARVRLSQYLAQHRGWARAVSGGLSRNPVDVLHVMNYWNWCDVLSGGPHRVVLEMQSEWLSQMPPQAVRRQLRHVDAVLAVSRHVRDLFRAAVPEYAGLVEVVPNGVDTDEFRPAERRGSASGRRHVLFVGRVSPEKGIHALVEAFSRLAAESPGVTLDIVGSRSQLAPELLVGISSDPLVRALDRFYGLRSDSYQRHLDQVIAERGLVGHVRFHGALPHAQLVELYRQADLVVNPSLSETFGISVVEGMACGVPVIGSSVGGMKDTIVPEVGYLVPPEDPAALADAMAAVLSNAQRAREMGEAGRARALESFTWKARGDRLMRLYERLCS